MKSQKLIELASAACLLLGVSSASMAVDCVGGVIEEITVDEIIIDGQSCFVNDVVVEGDVIVKNSEDFTMVSTQVAGQVLVKGGRWATLFANKVNGGIVAVDNERAALLVNVVEGSMGVFRNDKADVKANGVLINLVCEDNRRLDSARNEVGGHEDCRR
jgi:hypothetical protein